MEPANKVGRRRRRKKHGASPHGAVPGRGRLFPAEDAARAAEVEPGTEAWKPDRQGRSRLHVACLYGELSKIKVLVESGSEWVNNSDFQGHRPLHMVVSSCSSNADACLRFLLEHGADVDACTTDSGQTPLHLAASKGHLDHVEMLVNHGADVLAKDRMGLTPVDIARIWCHRKTARYLKNCMWQAEKKKEMDERKSLQALYRDLVDLDKNSQWKRKALVEKKVTEWTHKKGLPPLKGVTLRGEFSQYHTKCLLSENGHETLSETKHPPGDPHESISSPLRQPVRPWTIFLGIKKTLDEPDLRASVTMWRNKNKVLQLSSSWDHTPRPAPNLPQDVLQRVLFPKDFPPRMDFLPQDIQEVQHRGRPQGRGPSPWTEVAMHLPEVLEPGHY
ncbi:ankyrin repeat domain-containing protein 53 [Gouania willdenowi]|uniref:ankyrin repeat domain-containing protein 53 n=1 Tax=Gouania willdenowi TaxID=441366 RepID=UPI00105679C8|nr:ankyrin repeat domain-containing protein 53-like [Gouania willdenowi]